MELSFSEQRKYEAINLDKILVLPETAVKIAEENGGQSAREKYDKPCNLDVFLAAGERQEWQISYSDMNNGLKDVFKIWIDAQDGSYWIDKRFQ